MIPKGRYLCYYRLQLSTTNNQLEWKSGKIMSDMKLNTSMQEKTKKKKKKPIHGNKPVNVRTGGGQCSDKNCDKPCSDE